MATKVEQIDVSSDSSDDSIEAVPIKRKGKVRRGLVAQDFNYDDLVAINIYSNKAEEINKLKDKINDKNHVESVIGSTTSQKKETVDVIIDAVANGVCTTISDDDSPVELISSVQRNLPDGSPSPPPDNLRAKRGKRRGLRKVMAQLRDAQRNFEKNRVQEIYENVDEFSSDILCDDDNPNQDTTYSLKVGINGKIMKLSININEKFINVASLLASEHEVDLTQVLLTHHDEQIKLESTPASLKLTHADIIECYIMKNDDENCKKKDTDVNMLKLKLQSRTSRKRTEYTFHKFRPLSKLLETYAKDTNCAVNKLIIHFDGDVVNPDETPADLDLEDGDCLDIFQQ